MRLIDVDTMVAEHPGALDAWPVEFGSINKTIVYEYGNTGTKRTLAVDLPDGTPVFWDPVTNQWEAL